MKGPMVFVLLATIVLLLSTSFGSADRNLRATGAVIPAEFDEVITSQISSKSDGLLRLRYDLKNATHAVRIRVESFKSTLDEPLLVVIRRPQSVLSWQMPFQLEQKYTYTVVSRTLCPAAIINREWAEGNITDDDVVLNPIYVEFSTANREPIPFSVEANMVQNLLLSLDEHRKFNISPAEPRYFGFIFPDNVERVAVNIRGVDFKCMTVSVQSMECPVHDLDSDVTTGGRYQTITMKGEMSVRRSQFDRFFVTFVAKPDDESCCSGDECEPTIYPDRIKEVEVWIDKSMPLVNYWIGIATPLIAFAIIAILSVSCLICHGYRDHRDPELIKAHNQAMSECRDLFPLIRGQIQDERLVSNERSLLMNVKTVSIDGNARTLEEMAKNSTSCPDMLVSKPPSDMKKKISAADGEIGASSSSSSASSIAARDGGLMTQDASDRMGDGGKETIETIEQSQKREKRKPAAIDDQRINVVVRAEVVISDLSTKAYQDLGRQYSQYLWNAVTFSIFFALPAGLVVYTYRKVVRQTGNEDILVCYYNYQCARPLKPFYSFNAFYSNIGYILLGILFLLIVGYRQFRHSRRLKKNEMMETKYGVPRHYGLFYSMGYALMMEGILSACYHVCPNHTNFQFDTTFMYIMAALCMIKVYQNRHPDITPMSHNAYLILAFITLMTMIGAYWGNSMALWIVFGIGLVCFILVASIEFYYNGKWHFDRKAIPRLFKYYRNVWRDGPSWEKVKPIYPDRMIFLVICNAVNIFLAWWGVIKPPMAFSMYLIIIFFADLMLYLGYYIVMKFYHHEPFKKRAIILWTISIACWGGSLILFLKQGADWTLSPAQSRELNHDCVLLDFYDMHDLWHFVSSFSLFVSFMAILIMDEGLKYTHQKDIAVF